jgi:hypothetical protein
LKPILPAVIALVLFDHLCAVFRAERGKPHTNKNQVPRFPSGVEGLPKAINADRVTRVNKG